ncbi:hypothetical protein IWZ01DRAFT_244808 [Phyllosticta capitalensis]
MRGGQSPLDGHTLHSPPTTRVGRLEREDASSLQDASDPEADQSVSSYNENEMDLDSRDEGEIDVADYIVAEFIASDDEAIFGADDNKVALGEQEDESSPAYKLDEVASVNTGSPVPEPNMANLGPHSIEQNRLGMCRDDIGNISSSRAFHPSAVFPDLYAPPPSSTPLRPPRGLRHRRGGSINMPQWEDLGTPTPAIRHTANLVEVNNTTLTPSLLPGRAELDEEEGQFFRTYFEQLEAEIKSKPKGSSNDRPPRKRGRPHGNQQPHSNSSSQLPVTRLIRRRPDSAVPCNNNNFIGPRVVDVTHDERSSSTVSGLPDDPESSPPSYPLLAPVHRAASATIVSSPSLATAAQANRHLITTPQKTLIDPSRDDPTPFNTETHVWNWSSRKYEAIFPETLGKEEAIDVPSDAFAGGFDSLHDVDFPYDGLAGFEVPAE